MKLHLKILIALGLGAKRNWHIFFAIITGIIAGLLIRKAFPPIADQTYIIYDILEVLGQIFIRLIEMVVIPLVVSSLIVGITSIGDKRQLGKIGGKTAILFILTTFIGVSIGTALVLTFKPGYQVRSLIAQESSVEVQDVVKQIHENKISLKEKYLEMVPSNVVKSLANADLVPIIIFTMVFGVALTLVGEIGRPIVVFFEAMLAATMKITDWIMIIAAPGIFSLTALSVSKMGLEVFDKLSSYILVIIAGLLIQLFIVYPLLLQFFAKVNCWQIYKAVSEAMMVAFGTASSSATLPVTIACAERRAGISNRIASFVLPLGATMNMDGTAIFEAVAVIFLAQAYGVHLTMESVITISILAAIAAVAAAGVPSAGLITMALVLSGGVGLSEQQILNGIALIFIVDRFLDMGRTLVNVTSDVVVAAIIANSENDFDREMLENAEGWKEVV